MTKFNFMLDVAAILLLKLDIKKLCYNLFIKNEMLDLILLSVATPEFEFKSFLFQSIFGVKCLLIGPFVRLSIMMHFACLFKRCFSL